jgi:phosphatidate cytidylyltransferase
MAGSRVQTASANKLSPLAQRLIIANLIIIVGISIIAVGGYVFLGFVMLILGIAAWEFWRMYQEGGYRPSAAILIGGTVLLVLTRYFWDFETAPILFCLFGLATISTQVFDYRRAAQTAALDFAINLGGLLYVGWLGSYLVSLRTLPQGEWWMLLVVPTVGFCDGGAYMFGSLFGKHKMAPLISPKKT